MRFRRWKAQLTWHKVSEFANLLFFLGVGAMIIGVVVWPVLGWTGLALLVLGLVVLAWSDTFLPATEDKGKD